MSSSEVEAGPPAVSLEARTTDLRGASRFLTDADASAAAVRMLR